MKKTYICPVAYNIYGTTILYDPEDKGNNISGPGDQNQFDSKQNITVWDDEESDTWGYNGF